ncbi:hypothetical protein HELRODRAFT_165990 [Helobdella robusta]|uniref:Centrosomal protein CEP104 Zn finger domain-containing protein n=1 Tax=Helobdella robusta TaxID=6412 RepID=T1EXJ5_HELRO|nr:hypothetical protein HELRODRAFT_165990 [Helobdella robusta]ESN90332.1 hypothetical protein HELRODRAFT_165990 [Helobdella robusta]
MAQWLKAPCLAATVAGFKYKEIPAYHMQCVCFCDFCEIEQPKGSLNEHYKYRCPMLMKCPYCSDLKEVNQYYKHIKGECICTVNNEDLKDIAKDRCPLCKAKVLDLMCSRNESFSLISKSIMVRPYIYIYSIRDAPKFGPGQYPAFFSNPAESGLGRI